MNTLIFKTLSSLYMLANYASKRRIRGARKLIRNLESRLGFQDYTVENPKWKKLGLQPFKVKNTDYYMILDMSYWAQRISYIIGEYREVSINRLLRKTLKSGDYFVDVGANVGFYTMYASYLIGKHGRVFAFEPTLESFRVLEAHVALNRISNVALFQIALSDRDTEGLLGISGAESGGNNLRNEYADVRPVQEVRGDRILSDIPTGSRGVVKIDTEGYELRVLEGLKDFIVRQHNMIYVVEVSPGWISDLGGSVQQLFDIMGNANLMPYGVDGEGQLKPLNISPLHFSSQMNVVFKHR